MKIFSFFTAAGAGAGASTSWLVLLRSFVGIRLSTIIGSFSAPEIGAFVLLGKQPPPFPIEIQLWVNILSNNEVSKIYTNKVVLVLLAKQDTKIFEEGNRKNGIKCWLTLHYRPGKIAITELKERKRKRKKRDGKRVT